MKASILSVEDSSEATLILKAVLDKDYNLQSANKLSIAKKLLLEGTPSLIILDANLPDGDGFSFCKWLKKDSRYNSIPVVFVTGRKDSEEKRFALELGASAYLTKPVKASKLKEIVSQLLN